MRSEDGAEVLPHMQLKKTSWVSLSKVWKGRIVLNLIDRIKHVANGAEVIQDWLGGGGITVSQEQAQQRASICLTCPENKPGRNLTEAVASAIRKHVEVKNALQLRVEGEKRLHQCSICTCALRLKVWVPIDSIRKHMDDSELGSYPAYCWQKTE